MGSKLFVGGLSWSTAESGLRAAFEGFGPLREVKVVTDRETGRSRGFGFVTYEKMEDAKKALTQMDGASIEGRTIRVNEAEEKPRSSGGPTREGSGYSRPAPSAAPVAPYRTQPDRPPAPRSYGEDSPRGGRNQFKDKPRTRWDEGESSWGDKNGGRRRRDDAHGRERDRRRRGDDDSDE